MQVSAIHFWISDLAQFYLHSTNSQLQVATGANLKCKKNPIWGFDHYTQPCCPLWTFGYITVIKYCYTNQRSHARYRHRPHPDAELVLPTVHSHWLYSAIEIQKAFLLNILHHNASQPAPSYWCVNAKYAQACYYFWEDCGGWIFFSANRFYFSLACITALRSSCFLWREE